MNSWPKEKGKISLESTSLKEAAHTQLQKGREGLHPARSVPIKRLTASKMLTDGDATKLSVAAPPVKNDRRLPLLTRLLSN
ncbi:hypothetical protein EVAR_39453_1 [Eumeta japonica]|uniref:Uncharacterized protein n=1 Tax=Eumeta variegata TaxID=151549 RepID=A0A4C1W301_EUMVA|nr:hypothetical protein EVAR_39453_1 [Eumeta japonica]